MDDKMNEVRSDIAETRAELSATIAELEGRVSGKAKAVRDAVNPLELARANPWPALLVALGAGAAIAASAADRSAARVTVRAGKRAPGAAARAAQQLSSKASEVAEHAMHGSVAERMSESKSARRQPRGGALTRLWDSVDTRLAEFAQETLRANNVLGAPTAGSRPAGA